MKVEPPRPKVEPLARPKVPPSGDDKFVDEWMDAVRRPQNEELLELKNKLKKKESESRGSSSRKPSSDSRRHDRRSESSGRSESSSSRRRDDSPKKSKQPATASSDLRPRPKGTRFEEQGPKKILDKPIIISRNRFPFIGKMPSKLTTAKKPGETDAGRKATEPSKGPETGKASAAPASKGGADSLETTMRKQLAALEGKTEPDACNAVVDMDINDDEEEHAVAAAAKTPAVDDDVSRCKDFEQTLKILYPEDSKQLAEIPLPVAGTQQAAPSLMTPALQAVLQPMVAAVTAQQSQLGGAGSDYLMSLIESTLVEKLKAKMPGLEMAAGNRAHIASQLANTVQQVLSSFGGAAEAAPAAASPPKAAPPMPVAAPPPMPVAAQPPPKAAAPAKAPAAPPAPAEIDDEAVPGTYDVYVEPPVTPPPPPGTDVDDDEAKAENASAAKKKNPISQKKRRHLRKIRERLEEQEKQLQEQIEAKTRKNSEAAAEKQPQLAAAAEPTAEAAVEPVPPPLPVTDFDSDLMLLGIDEADSAALQF